MLVGEPSLVLPAMLLSPKLTICAVCCVRRPVPLPVMDDLVIRTIVRETNTHSVVGIVGQGHVAEQNRTGPVVSNSITPVV